MKLKIETVIEIPDDCLFPDIPHEKLPESALEGQARQIIFDSITNFATTRHSIEAMKWLNEDEAIFNHHNVWAEICNKLEWKMTKLDE